MDFFELRSPDGGLLTWSFDGLPSLLSSLHVSDKDIIHENCKPSIKKLTISNHGDLKFPLGGLDGRDLNREMVGSIEG